jgi:hypothetical protein
MKILCIDPGTEQSAWIVWDTEAHEPGEMGITKNNELADMLPRLCANLNLVAIEFPQCYGPGFNIGASLLHTCRRVGIFEAACAAPVRLYGRPTIKGQIGGRTDAEIRASLRMRYGEAKKGHKLEGVKKDLWAALALAVALEENPRLKEAA